MAEMQTNCILTTSNFVTHPQIFIFSVFQIASFPILIANKIFYQNLILVAEYHVDKNGDDVDECPVRQIDRTSK